MKEITEKCLHARYARTIEKVAIFRGKSDTVWCYTKQLKSNEIPYRWLATENELLLGPVADYFDGIW